MRFGLIDRFIALAVVAFLPVVALASSFEITPAVQAELEKQTKALAAWASDPVVIGAVKEQNATGYHLVAVDPYATIVAAGLGTATFSDIRAGDRIDYAVVTWAGADVAEMLMVTPRRHAELAR